MREVREECGVVVDPATVTPFWFTSTEPRPNRVLLFSIAAPVDSAPIAPYEANSETLERGVVFGPGGLAEVFAFPLHAEAARRFFEARGGSGENAYVVLCLLDNRRTYRTAVVSRQACQRSRPCSEASGRRRPSRAGQPHWLAVRLLA